MFRNRTDFVQAAYLSAMHIVEGGCYHNHGKPNDGTPKWAWIAIIVTALLTAIAVFRLLH